MTLAQAKTQAQMNSRNGYVQHVNVIDPECPTDGYMVDDWYDCDLTVVSYENGNELP